MNIAFYAPMKSPEHPEPSGDRLIARNTIAALTLAGHNVTLASSLRSWEGNGDVELQDQIKQSALAQADTLATQYAQNKDTQPELWFTYHGYHKSPDWLGPALSKRLNIPYVLMETSHAQSKPRNAPWQLGLEQTERCIKSADLIISINRADMEGVERVKLHSSAHCYVPPFIDTATFDAKNLQIEAVRKTGINRLLVVAMMRRGDKLHSYTVLAEALSRLRSDNWHLDIVGSGVAETEVHALYNQLMSEFEKRSIEQPPVGRKIEFHGKLTTAEVAGLMHKADYLVWPGINEALGMVYLEAQACGLPVVVGEMPGTADLVQHQRSGWLVAEPNASTVALAIDHVCALSQQVRKELRSAAVQYCHNTHSIPAAAKHIDKALRSIKRAPEVNL